MTPIDLKDLVDSGEIDFQFVKSSGKGGQNVNKVNTKAVLTWDLDDSSRLSERVKERLLSLYGSRINQDGVLIISSERFRSQKQNIDDCLEKLADILIKATHKPKPRKKTRPTRAAKEKRLNEKRHRAERKAGRQRIKPS